ncbi:hypothetical protein CEXT_167681 [Caerostris extrusa]|uniref:Uncharacterized protein n=1 Tax=Caerostris extrusa TaxID=172846 RepID=A0AAV4VYF0_CAEEX|nr:hypothetical protein CEXT_167681 [Caerostris extrusa]
MAFWPRFNKKQLTNPDLLVAAVCWKYLYSSNLLLTDQPIKEGHFINTITDSFLSYVLQILCFRQLIKFRKFLCGLIFRSVIHFVPMRGDHSHGV